MKLHPLVKEVLFTEEQIKERTIEVAKEIKAYYEENYQNDNSILVIGLLKGCVPFYQTFCMNFDFLIDMDFMVVSSYLGGTKSNGEPKINLDINMSVKDRNIIIVEDIVESGYTLEFVQKYLLNKCAKSVKILTMLDKPTERKVAVKPDWTCFTIPKNFLIGYGLDYQEKLRNLPYIAVCDTDKLADWKW
ncbi:hypoxanthine phosphoribosyltransferase [Mesoplasma melaleucae]|uniref:Hypoxanthine phosphoribosyltransferase n=1 Tax=Mesoplasma melaleucae TaxID=81459 RepID=A0A2K8NWE7_9MOLU|nr:hypoxanthine phosphoribosyltransferase [Mesoplasma melaleucae]ATZ18160.1 hypoxanthine-guanine phosphoribosyltransferase [Mesoplasma melaleucae]